MRDIWWHQLDDWEDKTIINEKEQNFEESFLKQVHLIIFERWKKWPTHYILSLNRVQMGSFLWWWRLHHRLFLDLDLEDILMSELIDFVYFMIEAFPISMKSLRRMVIVGVLPWPSIGILTTSCNRSVIAGRFIKNKKTNIFQDWSFIYHFKFCNSNFTSIGC